MAAPPYRAIPPAPRRSDLDLTARLCPLSVGRRKNSSALSALRSIQTNGYSRHSAMARPLGAPPRLARQEEALSILLKLGPQSGTRFSAASVWTAGCGAIRYTDLQ